MTEEAENGDKPDEMLVVTTTLAGQMLVNHHLYAAIDRAIQALEAIEVDADPTPFTRLARQSIDHAGKLLKENGDRFFSGLPE